MSVLFFSKVLLSIHCMLIPHSSKLNLVEKSSGFTQKRYKLFILPFQIYNTIFIHSYPLLGFEVERNELTLNPYKHFVFSVVTFQSDYQLILDYVFCFPSPGWITSHSVGYSECNGMQTLSASASIVRVSKYVSSSKYWRPFCCCCWIPYYQPPWSPEFSLKGR